MFIACEAEPSTSYETEFGSVLYDGEPNALHDVYIMLALVLPKPD
jgi:hypothetical protein